MPGRRGPPTPAIAGVCARAAAASAPGGRWGPHASLGRGHPRPEDVQSEQRHAHADGRVRQVEGGPVIATPVEVEEIRDRAEPPPIDEIADGAAEDEAERQPRYPAPG